MVSERVKKFVEGSLIIRDTGHEEYWNRIIIRSAGGELRAIQHDIKLLSDEIKAAESDKDTKAMKELEALLKLKQTDERLLTAIITEARRILADENIEIKEERLAERSK
jgi:hypothetical protein